MTMNMNTPSEQDKSVLLEVDHALRRAQDEERLRQTDASLQGNKTVMHGGVAQLLRVLGSIIIVGAAATFLLQRWASVDHVVRYLSFLGFTGILAMAGLASGLKIGDSKAARTFFALTLVLVPVNFSQLGALIYSIMPGAKPPYPFFFEWSAPSIGAAVLTTGLGVALLVPFALMAFRVLARNQSVALTGVYCGMSALLLLPSRTPGIIGLLAVLVAAFIAYLDERILAPRSELRTTEGYVVRSIMMIPLALIVGRNLNLYGVDTYFVSALLALVAIVFFAVGPRLIDDRLDAWRTVALLPAGASYKLFLSSALLDLSIGREVMIPLVSLSFAGILILAGRFLNPAIAQRYRVVAALIAGIGSLQQLASYGGIGASLLCVVIGVGSAVFGTAVRSRSSLFSGLFVAGIGLAAHVRYAVRALELSPWISLGVFGVVLVLASTLFERTGGDLVGRLRRYREEIREW